MELYLSVFRKKVEKIKSDITWKRLGPSSAFFQFQGRSGRKSFSDLMMESFQSS